MNTDSFSVDDRDSRRAAGLSTSAAIAYFVEAKYEFIRILRTPGYVIPMLPIPILLYVLIGVMLVGGKGMEDPKIPIYMFAAFVTLSSVSPGLFGLGVSLAVERQSGLLTLKRAQPMPTAAYLVAKMLTAFACTAIVMVFLIPLAVNFGHLHFDAMQIGAILASAILGVMTFCAIGCFIGSVTSGTAATGIINLVFFPMIYLSGMFFPLPKVLAPWALLWPTFYLDQLVVAAGGGQNVIDVRLCVAVLVGLVILFGGLALQRLARRG